MLTDDSKKVNCVVGYTRVRAWLTEHTFAFAHVAHL